MLTGMRPSAFAFVPAWLLVAANVPIYWANGHRLVALAFVAALYAFWRIYKGLAK